MIELLIGILILASFGLGFYLSYKYKQFKTKQLERRELELYTQAVIQKRQELKDLDEQFFNHLNNLNQAIEQEASTIATLSEKEKERAREAFSAYISTLESYYAEKEEEFDSEVQLITEELEKMKAIKVASIKAALREKELKEKENFYKISLSADDLSDIEILENIKPKLRHPEVLSKLIWTTYYQKQISSLCNNILGNNIVCGIYKITDTITNMVYIGQSVNIAQRWKDHVKAALGAGTTTPSNKLYKAMQEDGIHNFTFELLEEVPAVQLNEKEKFYIDFYQSSNYGLNSVRGTGR